jgi:hypothetical protein
MWQHLAALLYSSDGTTGADSVRIQFCASAKAGANATKCRRGSGTEVVTPLPTVGSVVIEGYIGNINIQLTRGFDLRRLARCARSRFSLC